MKNIIETIDPKNPTKEDVKLLIEELERLKKVDVRTVKKEDLVEQSTVHVKRELPKLERIIDYIKQIKNPYCFLVNGTIVKVSYKGEKTFAQCLKEMSFGGGLSYPVLEKRMKEQNKNKVR